MTFGDKYRIKANVTSSTAGAVYTVLSFHASDDHTGSPARPQIVRQASHFEGVGSPLFEYHLSTQKLQFLRNHRQRAVWFDWRSRRPDVAREKNRSASAACLVRSLI
jgi:hypothetical protein